MILGAGLSISEILISWDFYKQTGVGKTFPVSGSADRNLLVMREGRAEWPD